MDPKPTSTADIPLQFLKAVMLVGSVPFKALYNDQRISYTLYVPPEQYNPDPNHQLHAVGTSILDPVYQLPRLPLLVNIHGTGRNAEKCRDLLIPFAKQERVAVLAPLYPAGIDSYDDLDNYKLLRYKSLRSDIALLEILDEVAARWPGIATDKVFMMGFSGGGQFVHRFMYLHPERLHAVSIGAPGRVTYLDSELRWPKGIQDVEEMFGKGTVVEKTKVGALRGIQLVVGDADNFAYGGAGFWEWRRSRQTLDQKSEAYEKSSETLQSEVTGRMETLKSLHAAWHRDGIVSELDVVGGGVGHESEKVLPAVLEFFRPLARELRGQGVCNQGVGVA